VNVITMSLQRVTEATFPAGARVHLPGRGHGHVYHAPGPPGSPTLILLHGLWATGSLNWFPAFAPLREHFGVAAVDLRGHGRGLPVDGHFRVSDCADDVAALVDALGTGPAILVGYSLGGVVAQLAWRRHPERVAGLVLCATARNFAGTWREQVFFRGMLGATLAARAASALHARGQSDGATGTAAHDGTVAPIDIIDEVTTLGRRLPAWAFDEMRRCNPLAAMGAMAALGRFSSHAWIGEVDVPAAVVVTARDRLISPIRQRKLAAAIPEATVHEVDGDHGACVLGADRFIPVLVDACQSVAGRARRSVA
jgi:pimeloyl-ACP methyl ester carboxylesterase